MDTVRRIAKNTLILLLSQVLGYGLGFFYIMYTARHLGAEGFGVLSFALAFTAIFGIFTDFGLQLLTVREVARDKALASKYLSNLSAMKLAMCVLTFLLIALTINLMNYPGKTVLIVYIITLAVMMNAFITMFYSIFQAFEKMEYQSVGQILNGVLLFLGVLAAMKWDFGVTGFAMLYVLSGAVCLIYSIAVLKVRFPGVFSEWLRRSLEVDRTFWVLTWKETFPFGLAMFFVMIFYWIDSVMLSVMKGDAEVGWYNAAYRIVLVLPFIPQSLIAAIYPVTSMFYKTSTDSLRTSFEKSFKYLTIISVPIGVATTLIAKRIILPIYGEGYSNSILPLQILVWSSVFIFMSISFGNLFNSLNRQSIGTKITGVCALVNVALNIILIPRLSLIGAGISTVLTELVSLFLCFVWSSKIGYAIPLNKLVNIFLRVAVSSAIMGFYITIFHNMNILVLIPSAAAVYFISLYATRGIDKEDINLFQSVILRR